ncbi:GAF domain-containing sensor histidine kinase [Sphingomonas sp. SRS2]|uniref:GAF domain-containing sensor histidine kinase n=1 Tax=Sphingomonas sp. SRS2 TaxID=133190 RepID=UPI0006184270|nr:GAF domain-containing sensor histidine kinase [Sphingomonas sp. SRS2]KKC24950.1 histidine kinase [Sphingomonas sp. SRS2]
MKDFTDDIRLLDGIKAVPSILEVVCQATGMGFAAVARVTEDRWVACSVRDDIGFGLVPGSELKVETTICNEIRDHREPVIIDNVAADPRYRDHHTPEIYGLQSYISMPIILSDGSFFGTLCAIDPRPAQVSRPHIVNMFRLFAEMIGQHIEAGRRLIDSRHALLGEQEASALREQFIAVLGHDLRNPLAAIQSGMRLLGAEQLSARGVKIIGMIDDAVLRMAGIIDNVMDFARGRLGGGIALERSRRPLRDMLDQIVAEFSSSHPGRTIKTTITMTEEVDADHGRLGQLFSNLLGNAIVHGSPDMPIRVEARVADGHLELRIVNGGDPISPAAMDKLFTPFARGEVKPSLQGLGLGLYIASQIAQAHGGTLTASSDGNETVFLFRMPIA